MWHYGITQNLSWNNDNYYNDDNVILDSWMVNFNVKNHDIWEENVTIKSDVSSEDTRSLGFRI